MEFAFVLPVLLAITFAAIFYSYAFAVQQSITFAAQEAAEATVAIRPENLASEAAGVVQGVVNDIVDWMPSELKDNVIISVDYCEDGAPAEACTALSGSTDAVVVEVTIPLTGTFLAVMDSFFPMPANLSSQAVARV